MCALLALGTLVLYWPVRGYDFVQYDDNEYVFDNPVVKSGLSWWGLVWSFVDAHVSNWHPLTWLSHMLDCQVFGLNAGGHHLVNVALHCANAVLLFLLLRSLTGAFWRSAFVAALFAWHPLHVESVAWISERKDVLSGLFFMLTMWAYVRYAKSKIKNSKIRQRRWYGATLLFLALGLLSKPMLVTVPFVLLLLDFWPLNRFQPSVSSLSRALLIEKVPFFCLSAVICLITIFAQKSGGAITSAVGWPARIENVLVGYLAYLEKLFWPRDLSVLYLRPQTVPAAALMLAVLILSGISIAVLVNLRRRPYLAVGWLWFVGMLLPVSGLVPIGLQLIADRYTYLPSIGLFIMLTWGATDLGAMLFTQPARQFVGAFAAVAVVSACAVLSSQQLTFWQNTETLMGHALRLDPDNYVAHSDLGIYLLRQGQTNEARFHFERARELDPALNRKAGESGSNGSSRRDSRPAPEDTSARQ